MGLKTAPAAYQQLCATEIVPRQIIENQLLVALDDKSKVAIIADQELLEFLISAAASLELLGKSDLEYRDRVVRDLHQLHDGAFT